MKAELYQRYKEVLPDGSFIEWVIWRLPRLNPERPHRMKYRLAYIREGQRLVGYDNEQGKGDHKHIGNLQVPYRFVSIDQLLKDFLEDVRDARGED
ncbi:DUF6516 family protein [soil metagenome]